MGHKTLRADLKACNSTLYTKSAQVLCMSWVYTCVMTKWIHSKHSKFILNPLPTVVASMLSLLMYNYCKSVIIYLIRKISTVLKPVNFSNWAKTKMSPSSSMHWTRAGTWYLLYIMWEDTHKSPFAPTYPHCWPGGCWSKGRPRRCTWCRKGQRLLSGGCWKHIVRGSVLS